MHNTLAELRKQLAAVEIEIKNYQALQKLQNTRVNHHTMPKRAILEQVVKGIK